MIDFNYIILFLEPKLFWNLFFTKWLRTHQSKFFSLINNETAICWLRGKKDDKEGQYIQVTKKGEGGLRFSGTANQPDIHRN